MDTAIWVAIITTVGSVVGIIINKSTKRTEEVLKKIDTIVTKQNSLSDKIDGIEVKVYDHIYHQLRKDVLDFSDKLHSREIPNNLSGKESFENIFDEIKRYEELQEKYKFRNEKMTLSIEHITKKYKEMFLN